MPNDKTANTDVKENPKDGPKEAGAAGAAGKMFDDAYTSPKRKESKESKKRSTSDTEEQPLDPHLITHRRDAVPPAQPESLPTLELIQNDTETQSRGKQFSENAKTVFSKVDTDGDGKLTNIEIDKAVNNADIKGAEAQVVAAMKTNNATLSSLVDDGGFTLADLEIVEKKSEDGDAAVNGVLNSVSYSAESLAKAKKTDYKLFAAPNALDSIVPEAATQGGLGDCYFISALSSAASTEQGRRAIRDMIQENKDGTYTVTFPGAPDEPIRITRPTDAQLALYAKATEHGIWAAVLEKAYGEYSSRSVLRRNESTLMPSEIPQENVGEGSCRADGLRMISPGGVNSYDFNFSLASDDELDKELTAATQSGRAITLNSNEFLGEDTLTKYGIINIDDKGVPRSHEFAVIGYDTQSKQLIIRNPWGRTEPRDSQGRPKDGVDDGVYRMSLEEVRKTFKRLNVAEKAPSGRFLDSPIKADEKNTKAA